MSKTDQLLSALRERYTYTSRKSSEVDTIVLGYFTGLLGVLEKSDEKLMEALSFHLNDTINSNKKQGIA